LATFFFAGAFFGSAVVSTVTGGSGVAAAGGAGTGSAVCARTLEETDIEAAKEIPAAKQATAHIRVRTQAPRRRYEIQTDTTAERADADHSTSMLHGLLLMSTRKVLIASLARSRCCALASGK
jgi:hypothetical protein